jgi:phage terminase large subunit-like protein
MDLPSLEIAREGNPLYPLPPDYFDLTEAGQREARVNGLRQWIVHRRRPNTPFSPDNAAESYVASIRLFDEYYLRPDPEVGFDPMFYKKGWVETSPFYWDIARGCAIYPANLAVCPRGSAKSTGEEKQCMMELITQPGWEIMYATNTHVNANRRGLNMREQLYENPRLIEDFAPYFDGPIKPGRGDAPTGAEYFFLTNKSSIRMMSAQSALRGGRPNVFVLDDPENDEKASTSMPLIRSYMERLISGIILPMLMQPGCSIRWRATFVSKRHYAYTAMETRPGPDGRPLSVDPRFNFWNRILVRAAYEGPNGETISCWPEMWPATKAYKKAHPELSDRVSLEEIEERIGRSRFLSEYMARPGEGSDTFFNLKEEQHAYFYDGIDEEFERNPRKSNTQIVYTHQGKTVRTPLADFLKTARLALPVDSSYTATSESDYKACVLLALTPDNLLFALDAWAAKCHETKLIQNIFRIADRWRCPTIHPEVVKSGFALANTLSNLVGTRAQDVLGVQFMPGIKPLKPGMIEKTTKIAALSTRFEHGLMKFPMYLRHMQPWRMLFDQIDGFNPDANDGGLQNDDLLDCVSMSQYIFKGRPMRPGDPEHCAQNPREALLAGKTHDMSDNDMPYMHGIDIRSLSVKDFFDMFDAIQGKANVRHDTRA